MPKNTQEEKYRWIKPILDKEVTVKQIIKICPFSERSIKYWLSNYKKYGIAGLKLVLSLIPMKPPFERERKYHRNAKQD